jgi:hypothetical protein
MNGLSCGWLLAVLLIDAPSGIAQDNVIAPDISRINDGKTWSVINADSTTAMEDGKSVVRLKPKGKANAPKDILLRVAGSFREPSPQFRRPPSGN